ncbi:MAG TPA: acetolactate synthase small subunit [Dehalococcoidia bacterium]|nr:acetolactate synthase small subunit [Dehalococcoidia bacterium]
MVPSNHTEQHTLIALVEDKPGVLTRVASMFRRRGFNIASLAVGNSEQPGLSRMTFVVNGDDYTVSQVAKQLDKLIDVIEVSDITSESTVTRELALIKVKTNQMTRGEIIQIVNLFRANIIDVGSESMVIEMLRTGVVAMVRGQTNGLANGHSEQAGQVNSGSHS